MYLLKVGLIKSGYGECFNITFDVWFESLCSGSHKTTKRLHWKNSELTNHQRHGGGALPMSHHNI